MPIVMFDDDFSKRMAEISAELDAMAFDLSPVSLDQLNARRDRILALREEMQQLMAKFEADRLRRAD